MILVMLNQRWMFKNAKYKNVGKIRINKKKLAVLLVNQRLLFINIYIYSKIDLKSLYILKIPQSSSITGISPSVCLVSHPGHSLEGLRRAVVLKSLVPNKRSL